MPPSTTPKKERLYRLFFLIAAKEDKDGTTRKQIVEDLIQLLGVSKATFYQISNLSVESDERKLSVQQLLALAGYFNVSIEELVNQSLITSLLGPRNSETEHQESDSLPGIISYPDNQTHSQ